MHIIAGIVSYEPDFELLNRCVMSVIDTVEEVVIIDNASTNAGSFDEIEASSEKVRLIRNKENKGIAFALNQIFRIALENEMDYVLCLDQDTVAPNNMILVYKKIIEESDSERIGILCPRIHDRVSNRTWPENDGRRTMSVERCITSGSFNSVKAWNVIGGFDDFLFIDEVDHDYSYRIKMYNYEILLCEDVTIDHQIGKTKIINILGKRLYIRNHNAFRKYYIVRNMLYVGKKQYGHLRTNEILHAIMFTSKSVLFEKEKVKKLVACCRGFRDGVKCRTK